MLIVYGTHFGVLSLRCTFITIGKIRTHFENLIGKMIIATDLDTFE